jgi:hypothetical protein
MTPRTIVTSQPDVACDVCERRLLRGEQPDIFIAAGRRLTVCELCAPRAAHEGWMRESSSPSLELPPGRPRRGRSFIERLRGVVRVEDAPTDSLAAQGRSGERLAARGPFDAEARGVAASGSIAGVHAVPAAAARPDPARGGEEPAGTPPADPTYVELAVDVFNSSEFPRRIAGVARSLGVPEVSVRAAEHLSSVIVIVVAWELCWYRYEVDLSEAPPTVTMLEQGTELTELRHDDRLANAIAAESGALVLAADSHGLAGGAPPALPAL